MIIHPPVSNGANLFENIKFPPYREGYPRVDVQFEKSEFANSANRNVSKKTWRRTVVRGVQVHRPVLFPLCVHLVTCVAASFPPPPLFSPSSIRSFFFFFSFFEVGSFGRIRSTSLFAQDEKEREREEKSWQKRGGEKGLAWLVEPLQRNKKPPVKEERADLLRKPQATLSTQPCNYNAFAFV